MMPDPTCPDAGLAPSRRAFLAGAATLTVWPFLPRFAAAAPGGRDPRLIVVVLRGAMDGLSAVAPVGDPDYAALRGAIALGRDGPNAALGLDGFFALHPAMPTFARLYKAGKAMVVHAVASPYRERSHFDGQDVLESGLGGVGRADSGWLNRALQALPAGERIARAGGLGVGTMTPLIMRGAAPVLGWSPQVLPRASDDFAARVLDLYRHADPGLAETLERGLATDKLAAQAGMGDAKSRAGAATAEGMKLVAAGAAHLLAAADGPRLAALSFDGWDTHANEGGATGRLAQLLGGLDGAFAALETGLGPAWRDTAVLVATEFGRTAAVNGTVGTDHGTATVAFLAGGAVRGGRILADWPGLKTADLYEARDLKPTTDLRAIAKGLLADHLGLSRRVLDTAVFPDSTAVAPVADLIG
ncbi:hypothetical protein ABB55_21295 [Prosthecomicrobium hirschii]|uniref:Twin-arginine translocation pathway signal n=1 Tax=Prosthecodimorpha hirschii TaxID=665126 RepID=A0A0P6VT64_9HYPH|nr:DUF1501 domain-containing protein [Prosthecomicrobium hirschii]KPL54438.1 hypothetical protein ABB55_21295 [Prosthecomicrobium hirschii]